MGIDRNKSPLKCREN